MTKEEALQAIKAKMDYYESDKRLRAAIETLIPELKESEEEYIRKDALIEWTKHALKCQEKELAKYDGPSYGRACTMGRIDAYKVLIAKLNSL